MDTRKPQNRQDEAFKKSLVELCRNGKTQTQRCKEYGVSPSALGKWVKQYSIVQTEDGDVLTDKQFKKLQKRNAQLEEALILKKRLSCSRHTRTTAECSLPAKLRACNQDIVPCSWGQLKRLL